MRTSIDVPDELLKEAKIAAASRGITLKEMVIAGLVREVRRPYTEDQPKFGHQRPVPVSMPLTGKPLSFSTNAEIEEIFYQEDLERAKFD